MIGVVVVEEAVAALGVVVGAVAALVEGVQTAEEVVVGCAAIGSPGRTWVGKMVQSDKRGLSSTGRYDEVDSSLNDWSSSLTGCSR